jgi:nucleoside-diphosphate-sugar epimerase
MKNPAKMRIALIGGAGFIGHNLALRLRELGSEVLIIDSLEVNNLMAFANHRENPIHKLYFRILNQRVELLNRAGVRLKAQDAREYHQTGFALKDFSPQTIVHLAAVAHANKSNKDPHSTFDHSLRTLENALDYAKNNVEHFVYFSSSMVYGNFLNGFVTEDSLCDPLGIYGALKFAGEKLVIAYHQVFGLPYTIVRPSALYGERCVSGRVGQKFIENAFQGLPLNVNGDGSDSLDFTYIDDFVDGMLRMLSNEKAHNEIFNLTYGQAQSLNTMIDMVRQRFPEVTVNYQPADRLMPKRGTLSIEKATRLLGYVPQFPLEKGFPKYIDWYRDLFRQFPDVLNGAGKG